MRYEEKQGNKRVTGKLFLIWWSQKASLRRCYLRPKFERQEPTMQRSRGRAFQIARTILVTLTRL